VITQKPVKKMSHTKKGVFIAGFTIAIRPS
jgi:hypothetical protein